MKSSEFRRILDGCFLGSLKARNLWRKSLIKMLLRKKSV